MGATLDTGDTFPREGAMRPPRRRIVWPPLIALLLAGGVGLVALLPTDPEPPDRVLARRELRPVTRMDGAIDLLDAANAVAATVPAEGDSFVRGVLSSINYQRRRHGVPEDAPLMLTALDNGRVVLDDARTATSIDLEAFGPDNLAQFAHMLSRTPSPERAQ